MLRKNKLECFLAVKIFGIILNLGVVPDHFQV